MAVEIIAKLGQFGGGTFKLLDADDIDAGSINVVLQLIASGALMAGAHATAPEGEIVVQRKTTTGAPTHTATEGTPCWNSVDDTLYMSLGGGSWQEIGGGGGGTQNLYVQETDPGLTVPGMWVELNPDGSPYTVWIEDGL